MSVQRIPLTRGQRFKKAREEFNQYGKQDIVTVARTTDIQQSMISDLENDMKYRDVGYTKIVTLAEYYGVSVDYLLGLSEEWRVNTKAADQLGITPKAVAILSDYASWNKEVLSAVLEDPGFHGLIAAINRLCLDVENMHIAYQRGWQKNIEDSEKVRHLQTELSKTLGFSIEILEPKHAAIANLSQIQEVARNLAERISGYNKLSYSERLDSELDADPEELYEYFKAKYPDFDLLRIKEDQTEDE